MGIIDLKLDLNNQKVLGAILKAFLDIPKWLKTLVVLSSLSAVVYFGIAQGYLYNDQINELKKLQIELSETKQKIQFSVLSLEEYNKDYTDLIKEFILIKEMNDKLLEMHDEQVKLLLEYLKTVDGPSKDLTYLENSIYQNERYFKRMCNSYLKRSILYKDSEKIKKLQNQVGPNVKETNNN